MSEELKIHEILPEAHNFARLAHKGHFRRDGRTPYFEHVEAVSARVEGELAKSVALLHDIVEDTQITTEQLSSYGFPWEVVEAVGILTKSKEGFIDRAHIMCYPEWIREIKNSGNKLAIEVKKADMLSNLSDDPTPRQIEKYVEGLGILLNIIR